MKKYKVCFVGRIGGALGTSYPITENEEAIRSMLWDKYDSMGRIEVLQTWDDNGNELVNAEELNLKTSVTLSQEIGVNMLNKIALDDAIKAHDSDIDRLDPNKTCSTCKHEMEHDEEEPCKSCFNTFLWRHFNPTEWEPHE